MKRLWLWLTYLLRRKPKITEVEAWKIIGDYYSDEIYRTYCRYENEIISDLASGLSGDKIAYKIYGRLKK